ncbi:hypothetical protein [Pedobacter metabolipauper]|uniref:hypothetical protein n=1 Tax=Pedobacter metabolipauper TaxID=425513 RepID=UPI00105C59B4|nr:hypothetical protein [Pedobacter metabolipauper]
MRRKQAHIHKFLAISLLLVFAIALTPFSAFHHHNDEPKCAKEGYTCTHKSHIGNHAEKCLVCAMHFEKNYTYSSYHYQLFEQLSHNTIGTAAVSGTYSELISLALRGPPVV